jgi:hypothetical protein
MSRIKLIFFLIFAGLNQSQASEARLAGKADPEYFNREIIAWTPGDPVSHFEKIIGRDTISSKGFFSFTFKLDHTIPLYLRTGNVQARLYIQPGKKYKIGLLKKDPSVTGTFGNPAPVELVFMDADSTELNFLIREVDNAINKLLSKQKGSPIADQRPTQLKKDSVELKTPQNLKLLHKIDSLEKELSGLLKISSDPYFKKYFASAFGITRLPLLSGKTFFEKYLKGQGADLSHFENTWMWSRYFEAEFESRLYGQKAIGIIQSENLKEFSALLKSKYFVLTDTLRDLQTLTLLSAALNIKNHKKENVCRMTQSLKGESAISLIQAFCENLSRKSCSLIPGAHAPQFSLPDKNQVFNTIPTKDQKHTYLIFWRSDIKECEELFFFIPELKKKYGAKINFVAINMDPKPDDMSKFLQRYPKYDWLFLYGGNDLSLTAIYQVKAFPLCYLVNTFGRFSHSPAPEPGAELEKIFEDIRKKGQKGFLPGQKEN